jgi:multidrug efflux pump
VATTLLTLAIVYAGILAYCKLPLAAMPEIKFPVVVVNVSMPGASPETMATTVATPLERHLSAIADVSKMESENAMGETYIVLEFGQSRDLDGAARDVQAAINAARADLPAGVNPTYITSNTFGPPALFISLTSSTLSREKVFDIAQTFFEQKLASVEGVSKAYFGGSSRYAIRVELNPDALAKYGIGLEDVRAALAAANANSPKGVIQSGGRRLQIYTNDQISKAADYQGLVIAYRNGLVVKLADVAEVIDSVENTRSAGFTNGVPSITAKVYLRPDANLIASVDRIKARLPELRAFLPPGVDLDVVSDRTVEIRTALRDLERVLLAAVALVILTVFAFLRDFRAALIPAIVVAVSLIGTFGIIYLLGYSINTITLMALAISTGLVVDDGIIVLENIARHIDGGSGRAEAALRGAREIFFTVLAISVSLAAMFIPVLLVGGFLGGFLSQFAVTLSAAILISMVVSLTTAPMLCARLLRPEGGRGPGRLSRAFDRAYRAMLAFYQRSLTFALRHSWAALTVLAGTIALNVTLFLTVPKGAIPEQDVGRLFGFIKADQNTSFEVMREKLEEFSKIILADPAVETLVGDADASGKAGVYVDLKPLPERNDSFDEVVRRLSLAFRDIPGASLTLSPNTVLYFGAGGSGSEGGGQYQYSLRGDDIGELRIWSRRLAEALKHVPEVLSPEVSGKDAGIEINLAVDRDTASRLGISASQIDNALSSAFCERQVSTLLGSVNQYKVLMEVAPRHARNPETLDKIYVSTAGGPASGSQLSNAPAGTVSSQQSHAAQPQIAAVASDAARNLNLNKLASSSPGAASTGPAVSTAVETMVPLSAFARFEQGPAPVSISHKGGFLTSTISFSLPSKIALSEAMAAIERTAAEIHMPATIHAAFTGAAKDFQQILLKEIVLTIAAVATIYIVLGILYESFIHPVTILSTLPSAGVGALLALKVFHIEFSIIAFIGVLLVIGIVKKNAIMMIDFALAAERGLNLAPREAIEQACLLRFRPIMMTTVAALLGALPLALGTGEGGEFRQPLGVAIIGGLLVSQVLTLYTTPALYLQLDRLRLWRKGERESNRLAPSPEAGE